MEGVGETAFVKHLDFKFRGAVVFLKIFFLVISVLKLGLKCTTRDQEPPAVPTEPARCPSGGAMLAHRKVTRSDFTYF